MLGTDNLPINKATKYDMIVFTAPSGAGKTTIVKHLLSKYPQLSFSISATTRTKREKETDKKDYYFLSKETFQSKINNSDFIEYEEVYPGKYYGTLRSEVDRILALDKKVVFDIEINGAQNIKERYDERCLVVFVKPPSFRTLVQRLTNRGTETPDSLATRILRIKKELLYENSFDKILVNDKLEVALKEAEELVEKYVLDLNIIKK